VPFHTVTFTESGLPNRTSWQVDVDGGLESSTTSSILFYLTDGSYSYEVGLISGYHTVDSGTFSVNGSDRTVKLSFSPTTYTVRFTETGLASGSSWSVTFDGSTKVAATASISFTDVRNGTYSYSVGPIAGYHANSYSGKVTVAGGGSGTTSNVVVVAWTVVKYLVTFTETGLAPGTKWNVTVDSRTISSTGTSVTFHLANGTYGFTVAASGYSESSNPPSSVSVNGAQVRVAVTFTDAEPRGPV
jgi:hypothetical protein